MGIICKFRLCDHPGSTLQGVDITEDTPHQFTVLRFGLEFQQGGFEVLEQIFCFLNELVNGKLVGGHFWVKV